MTLEQAEREYLARLRAEKRKRRALLHRQPAPTRKP